jgi:ABC-type nickel/cobalt efflux system permease component RcnA
LTAVLAIGFLFGLRHATDADHVAAVSTFVSRDGSLLRSCLVGTFWGAGHTLALLVAGLTTIMFKLTISPQIEKALETIVAFVLVLLGGNVVLRALTAMRVHSHEHAHHGDPHRHVHMHLAAGHAHAHRHLLALGGRPFLVGLLHGLAGSAALMLLVLATIPSPFVGVLYILVFGIGSTAGMLVLSGAIAVPFIVTAGRADRLNVAIRAMAGVVSVVLGLSLLWTLHS